MPTTRDDLWSLVKGRPHIDPADLAEAVQAQVVDAAMDFRTRLLVRDSLAALQAHWGRPQWSDWLSTSAAQEKLAAIFAEDLGETRFTIGERLVRKTEPDAMRQFVRELGEHLPRRLEISIGGAGSLILADRLSRPTEDVDIVDEVPAELYAQDKLLEDLKDRFGLRLVSLQSCYFPDGWKNRRQPLGLFGNLDVHLVDVHDIFISKLFSQRTKDLDDLRVLAPQLDQNDLVERLRVHAGALRADARLLPHAERNWYILYGEILPS